MTIGGGKIGGQSKEIVTKWTLNADQYRNELKGLAKQIRADQRHTKDLSLAQKALAGQLSRSTSATRRYGAAMRTTVATMAKATAGGNLMAGAVAAMKNQLMDTAKEIGAYTQASHHYTGNLQKARGATQGLADDLTIMQAKNRLNILGVKLSDSEYNKLLGSLTKISSAMGIDMKFAIESATTMLARNSSAVADNIGVVVKAETAYAEWAKTHGKLVREMTSEEKDEAFDTFAIDQLTKKASELKPRIDDLASSFKQLGVDVKNAVLGMGSYLNKLFSMGEFMGPSATKAQMDFIGAAVSQQHAKSKSFDGVPRLGGKSPASLYAANYGLGGDGKGGKIKQKSKAGGKTGPSPFDIAMGANDLDVRGTGRGLLAELEAMEQLQNSNPWSAAAEGISQVSMESRLAIDGLQQMRQQVVSFKDEMANVTMGVLQGFAGGIWDIADAAVNSSMTFGAAMKNMVKSTLLGIARMASVEAVKNLAAGFGALGVTWGYPNPSSVNHFISAAKWGALAVGTGGAGVAMGAAGGGRGGGRGRGGGMSRDRGDGNVYRPNFSDKSGSAKGNGQTNVNVYFQADDPSAQLVAGHKIVAAMG